MYIYIYIYISLSLSLYMYILESSGLASRGLDSSQFLGLSLDVSPCFRIPFCGFTKALGDTFSVFVKPQSTTKSRCCLYFADFRALDPQSGGKRCTETSNDTEKVAQGSKGHLLECFWSFIGLMANAICYGVFKGATEGI